MKLQEVKSQNGAFEKLFGTSSFKSIPLCVYAEGLFYNGLDQMVQGYNGGVYSFVKITEADDIEVEPTGFLPLLKEQDLVVVTNPFNIKAAVSCDAACLIVWIFVLQQIAESIKDEEVQSKLYNTMEDFNSSYSEIIKDDGSNYFNEDDCRGIYRLLN